MVIKCRDRILDLTSPVVMGILNLTPDSFYDGGKYASSDTILNHVAEMVNAGAKIIDIGGMSSRPGAKLITAEEELDRIYSITIIIRKLYPELFISVDTIYARTAEKVLDIGVDMINDISAWSQDSALPEIVSKYQAGYVLMHMKGIPETMRSNADYQDVTKEVLQFLIEKIRLLEMKGVSEIVIDPGFGFGKNIKQNYELLNKMSVLRILDRPILAGISRKSMFHKFLGIKPEESLPATSIGHYISLCQGANILRVHDVKEAIQAIKIYQACNLKS